MSFILALIRLIVSSDGRLSTGLERYVVPYPMGETKAKARGY